LHASIIIWVRDFSFSTEYNFMRLIRLFGKRREVFVTLSSVVNNVRFGIAYIKNIPQYSYTVIPKYAVLPYIPHGIKL
jgi:uncharacterized protein YqiB (DUF1249 family)